MDPEEISFNYSAILFDFDGTLTPSLPLWLKAYQGAMAQLGVKLSSEEVVRRCFYRPWQEVVTEFELQSVQVLEEKVLDGLEEAFSDAYLIEGVMHTLDACRRKDTKLAIVTSSIERVVRKFLLEHNIADYFSSVVTAEHVAHHKPHPEPVMMALSHLELGTHQSLMVGDSSADILAARAANVDNALFFPDDHHQFYDFEKLRLHDPHFIFH
jgi:HAD superfamily hydrolase (TIGR01549 family)